jgi:hypothetical protein
MTRTVVQFRCSAEEKARIGAAAAEVGLGVSEFVRRAVLGGGSVPAALGPAAVSAVVRPSAPSRVPAAGADSAMQVSPGRRKELLRGKRR